MIKDDELRLKVWEKGRKIQGLNPKEYRKDACGAIMIYSKFGNPSDEFGWGIDHIYPEILGGDGRLENMRPMQYQNLISKGSDFPVYMRTVKAVDNRNVFNRGQCRVSETIIEKLAEIYGF